MKLIQTIFRNFRCYHNFELNYGSETTVLIGKNGTGKSSVLSAIRRGLSIFFMDSKTFSKNLNFTNTAKVKGYRVKDFKFDNINRIFESDINTNFKANLNDSSITWSLQQNSLTGKPVKEYYEDAAKVLLAAYNTNPANPLPLFAVYTDNFPHVAFKSKKEIKELIQFDILPRDFGYYKWDEENIILLWVTRFIKAANIEKDLKDDLKEIEKQIATAESSISEANKEQDKKKIEKYSKLRDDFQSRRNQLLLFDNRIIKFEKERKLIEEAFISFTSPLTDPYDFINSEFEISSLSVNRPDKKEFEITFNFKDGRNIMFDTLPMGYKRIFSIVLDIAYRSFILNETLESEGIVLIDEIELHLHPTLQQEVLTRLKKTFPNIQFIITTHSPLVISNFKVDRNNKIIKLIQEANDYSSEELEGTSGVDYTTNLREVMEVNPRSSTIDKYIDAYLFQNK